VVRPANTFSSVAFSASSFDLHVGQLATEIAVGEHGRANRPSVGAAIFLTLSSIVGQAGA